MQPILIGFATVIVSASASVVLIRLMVVPCSLPVVTVMRMLLAVTFRALLMPWPLPGRHICGLGEAAWSSGVSVGGKAVMVLERCWRAGRRGWFRQGRTAAG